jgi:creatinine amidohydrolase/Fe(II)-dependent formamide hydrolase-like protein
MRATAARGLVLAILAGTASVAAQTTAPPDITAVRPIPAAQSVFLEELTWLEVRDAIAGGTTTVIVPTGGIEQSGPYLAVGKHNYVNRALCAAVARRLGRTLCAPNVPFVPEGDLEPPSAHMRYPGTISVTEQTFRALLTDIAASLKAHGFQHILLVGDSGGNQPGLKAVAADLAGRWAGTETSIHYVPEYYDYPAAKAFAARSFGWKEIDEGLHDDAVISALVMTVDADAVRIRQRIAANKASINGVPLTPVDRVRDQGKQLVDFRAAAAADAIRRAIAK